MEVFQIKFDYDIFLKLLTLCFIGYDGISKGTSPIILVSYILCCLGITFFKYLLKRKSIFILIEFILTLYTTVNHLPSAALILSIEIMEYLLIIKLVETPSIACAVLLPVALYRFNPPFEILFYLILLVISFFNSYKSTDKISEFEREDLKQRAQIQHLESKLNAQSEIHGHDVYTARLEERAKISGKLHDKIGHTISAVLLQLEAIKFIMDSDPEKSHKMLDSSIETLRSGTDEIRMTLRNIRPAEEELGINRIKSILEEKTKNTPFKFTLNYSGDLDKISSSIWRIFLQCTMELSTNSIKYSKGNSISVSIEVLNKFLKLEVKDNGIGATSINKNLGLLNIEDKIAIENGKVILNGDDGFSAVILIPC